MIPSRDLKTGRFYKPKPIRIVNGVIYKLTSPSGKLYIGQSTVYNNRMNSYNSKSYQNKYNTPLHKSIRKYGFDSFKKEIIQQCSTKDELNSAEIYWIDYYKSLVPNGYNVLKGGGGYKPKGKKVNSRLNYRLCEPIDDKEARINVAEYLRILERYKKKTG